MHTRPVLIRLLIAACALVALAACVADPPVREMSDARQAIAAAEAAGADRFARDELDAAHGFLATAELKLAANAWGPARTNALRAQERAMRALRLAQATAVPEQGS